MQDRAFISAAKIYGRIIVSVLAVIGMVSLGAMQGGWLVATADADAHPNDAGQVPTVTGETAPLSGNGPTTVTSQLIPVDPSLTYDLSAEVRSLAAKGDDRKGARTYLGVVAYDKDGKRLSSKSAPNRYVAADDYYLVAARGWAPLSGTVGGEGNDVHSQFQPGTRFVRVIALLNNRDETMKSEIRNIRFTPRLQMGMK